MVLYTYNVFRQQFEYFRIKESAEIIANNCIDKFKAMLLEDITQIEQLFKKWFPDVSVKREETVEFYWILIKKESVSI